MSENGEIYTVGKLYTAAGTDGMDKFHLWLTMTCMTASPMIRV